MAWEYPTVLKRSIDKDSLLEAHDALVTAKVAEKIIFSLLDEGEVTVRFTGRTDRGRCEYREHKVKKLRASDIRLPAEKTGNLTIGLVLHELAHAIAWNDFNVRCHCDKFVEVLDMLVCHEWLCPDAIYWNEMGRRL